MVINLIAIRVLSRGRHLPVANDRQCSLHIQEVMAGQFRRFMHTLFTMGAEDQRVYGQPLDQFFGAGKIIRQRCARSVAIEIAEIQEIGSQQNAALSLKERNRFR